MSDGFSLKGWSGMLSHEAITALRKSEYNMKATGAQSDTTYYKQPLQGHMENMEVAPLDCRAITFDDGSFKIEQNGFGDIDPDYKMMVEWSKDEQTVESMQAEVAAQAEELTKDKEKPDVGL